MIVNNLIYQKMLLKVYQILKSHNNFKIVFVKNENFQLNYFKLSNRLGLIIYIHQLQYIN